MRRLFAALLLALLAACHQPKPLPAKPALWSVTGPQGEQAWLFGTIHALRQPYDWQTPQFSAALGRADQIVVEVAGLGDSTVIAAAFERLARTPGQPELSARIDPAQRGALNQLIQRSGVNPASFGAVETWAVALTLARAANPDQDTALGIDRAILQLAGKRPVVELEGAEPQLRIFDALPEADQRDLLRLTIAEAAAPDRPDNLAQAWARGDMALIERETQRGLLADPELRAALLVNRNRAWADRIAVLLGHRSKPLVAVGAAHMAGADGLPALLKGKGYTVTRLQ